MEKLRTINKSTEMDNVKLSQMFEVEELEERVEFGKWSASAEGGGTCGSGGCDVDIEGEVTYTITF